MVEILELEGATFRAQVEKRHVLLNVGDEYGDETLVFNFVEFGKIAEFFRNVNNAVTEVVNGQDV